MKKFITLLLVLTGMVSTASATDYFVFFKPDTHWAESSATYKLVMNSSSGTKSVDFAQVGTTGIYKATYESAYNVSIQFERWSSDGKSRWNYSNAISHLPTGNVYYDKSANDWWDTWTDESTGMSVKNINFVMASNRHIAANYDSWSGTSANNKMSTTDGVTYTLKVENKAIKEGYYGYKFVRDGSEWIGNGASNFYLHITADDNYDIDYSFNWTTSEQSAVATSKGGSPTITYKYYVYNKSTEDDGIEPLLNNDWASHEMTNDNGTYRYGITGKSLVNSKRYAIRFMEKVVATGRADQNNELFIGNDDGGSHGCRYYDCTSDGTYNFSISYKPSDCNYDLISTQPKMAASHALYALNSGDSWASGTLMNFTDGIYTATLTGMYQKNFVIAPTSSLSGDAWNAAIRPMDSGSSYNVHFEYYSGNGVTNSGTSTWYLDKDNCNVKISYNPIDNKWEVQPYRTATIGGAGYITYSNGEKCTVSGATAIYVIDANNTTSVRMKEMAASTVWPENEGMLLKGDNGDEITINAVAYGTTETTIGDNYLVGSGNSEIPITAVDGHYILNWNGSEPSTVGFYSVTSAGNLGAHKAYLDISGTPAREFLDFDFGNGTTGINTLNANQKILNGEFYNLAGQRVAQPTKGLYIVNGKKVIIK